MTKLKKGNLLAHAKASGKTVSFKKPARKRAAVKRAIPAKKAVRSAPAKKAMRAREVKTKPQYKHHLELRKTANGPWQKLLGSNSAATLKELGMMYAKKYPAYAWRVM